MNQERWNRLSYKQQIGNIGSELNRALHWERKADQMSRDAALERALDLIRMSLSTRTPSKLREMTRFEEAVCHCFANSSEYEITIADLETFCTAHFG